MTAHVPVSAHPLDPAWLLRLRTTSVVGILLLVLLVRYAGGVLLPMVPLALVLGVWMATNLAAAAWNQRRALPLSDSAIAALMALDAVLLTSVFYLTGGPSNPFNFLYLVHIALAAVALPPRFAWMLAGLSTALFGLLFLDHVPLVSVTTTMPGHEGHAMPAGHDMSTHLRGMWVAFALAAVLIISFTTRLRGALGQRERELVDARALAARSEQLASLATLAAGAAHELSTPLSTIAVVAQELQHDLESIPGAEEAVQDARLIHQQVARCRSILEHLRADAGAPAGEAPTQLAPADLAEAILDGLADRARVQVVISPALAGHTLTVYVRSLTQAIRGIVKNALDATTKEQVDLVCDLAPEGWTLKVVDGGTGMDESTLRRVGEPFFTTKPTGSGMGLGVFLAFAVAERLGGRLELTSTPGQGTTATFHLPLEPA